MEYQSSQAGLDVVISLPKGLYIVEGSLTYSKVALLTQDCIKKTNIRGKAATLNIAKRNIILTGGDVQCLRDNHAQFANDH